MVTQGVIASACDVQYASHAASTVKIHLTDLTDPVGAVLCSLRVSFATASSIFSLPKSAPQHMLLLLLASYQLTMTTAMLVS